MSQIQLKNFYQRNLGSRCANSVLPLQQFHLFGNFDLSDDPSLFRERHSVASNRRAFPSNSIITKKKDASPMPEVPKGQGLAQSASSPLCSKATTAYHTDYVADMGEDPHLHIRRVKGVDGKIALEISASGYLAVHASGLNFMHITTSKEAVAVPHGQAFAPHADNLDRLIDTDDFEEAVRILRQENVPIDNQSEGH